MVIIEQIRNLEASSLAISFVISLLSIGESKCLSSHPKVLSNGHPDHHAGMDGHLNTVYNSIYTIVNMSNNTSLVEPNRCEKNTAG